MPGITIMKQSMDILSIFKENVNTYKAPGKIGSNRSISHLLYKKE